MKRKVRQSKRKIVRLSKIRKLKKLKLKEPPRIGALPKLKLSRRLKFYHPHPHAIKKAKFQKIRYKKFKKRKEKKTQEKTLAISDIKEEYIETSIDKLLDLIEKRGMVSIGFAARALGYPKSEIEEWAKAMAEHGLIDMSYNMFNTILRKKSVKK